MKKNYQEYIESENFGQSLSFVAFIIETEDWSVCQRVSIIAINWIFSPKRLEQNLQTTAGGEENLPRNIESRNFGQYRTFVAFKIAIEDWSVYRTRVNNRYKLNFFSKTA